MDIGIVSKFLEYHNNFVVGIKDLGIAKELLQIKQSASKSLYSQLQNINTQLQKYKNMKTNMNQTMRLHGLCSNDNDKLLKPL